MVLKAIVGNTTLDKTQFQYFSTRQEKSGFCFVFEESFVLLLTLGSKESKVQKDT